MAPTTDYLSSGQGTFRGPTALIGPNDSYAVVFGADNTAKIVRLPYGGAAQTEAVKFDATAAATFAGPFTILGGGNLVVTNTANFTNPVNVSTGPLTVVTSGITVTAGGLTLTAGPLAGTPSPATTSGTILPTNGAVITVPNIVMRVAPTAAVTSAAITTGTTSGQAVVIVNNSGFPITFATQATSNIAIAGTTLPLINQQSSKMFVWDGVSSLWYTVGAATAI